MTENEKRTVVVNQNVTSHNQTGGVTAHTYVNQAPPPDLKVVRDKETKNSDGTYTRVLRVEIIAPSPPPLNQGGLPDAVMAFAERFAGGTLQADSALMDLLQRQAPRLKGRTHGAPLQAEGEAPGDCRHSGRPRPRPQFRKYVTVIPPDLSEYEVPM